MVKAKHTLEKLIAAVEKTHRGLGPLVALEALIVKSGKMLLVVAPHGTGKSKVSSYIGKQAPASLIADRISAAGLQGVAEELTKFKGVVIADDLAKTGTDYARVQTVTTLAELVYSGGVASRMSKLQYTISDFEGSAILNIQPILLRALVMSAEWEASVQDKAFRYYHLVRPSEVNLAPIEYKIDWGLDIDKVETPDMKTPAARAVLNVGRLQWGAARVLEHSIDIAKAAAAMDKREKVTDDDFKLIERLFGPLRIEQIIITKEGFEGDRGINTARLSILTEFITHGEFTIAQVADDYGISVSQAYKNVEREHLDWRIIGKKPTVYGPSKKMADELAAIGISLNGSRPAK